MGKTKQLEGKLMHWNYRIAKKRSEYIYKNEVKTHYDYLRYAVIIAQKA